MPAFWVMGTGQKSKVSAQHGNQQSLSATENSRQCTAKLLRADYTLACSTRTSCRSWVHTDLQEVKEVVFTRFPAVQCPSNWVPQKNSSIMTTTMSEKRKQIVCYHYKIIPEYKFLPQLSKTICSQLIQHQINQLHCLICKWLSLFKNNHWQCKPNRNARTNA